MGSKHKIIQWNCRCIKPRFEELLVPKLSRREEIALARLRIGHTRVTYSCLLKHEERPYCIGCDTPFTVRHFLLDCADFGRERRSLFQVYNLKDLFKDISVENILSFLAGLYKVQVELL